MTALATVALRFGFSTFMGFGRFSGNRSPTAAQPGHAFEGLFKMSAGNALLIVHGSDLKTAPGQMV